MNKLLYFHTQTKKLCKLIRIQDPVYIKDDKRLRGYTACIVYLENTKTKVKEYALKFNPTQIKDCRKDEIIHIILHELGHWVTTLFNKGKTIEDKEYFAELFALDTIKKYYNKYYKKTIYEVLNVIVNDTGVYKKAFTRVLKKDNILKEVNEKAYLCLMLSSR